MRAGASWPEAAENEVTENKQISKPNGVENLILALSWSNLRIIREALRRVLSQRRRGRVFLNSEE
jgi:hypothetical protein